MTGTHVYNTSAQLSLLELEVMKLSATNWRKYAGEIHLVCSDILLKYHRELANLYDTVKTVPYSETRFYSQPKLEVLESRDTCIVDCDLVLKKPLVNVLDRDILTAHLEDTKMNVVNGVPTYGSLINEFGLRGFINEESDALNTAILYIPNENLKEMYIREVFNILGELDRIADRQRVTEWLKFTGPHVIEQHLLGHIVSAGNYRTQCLLHDKFMGNDLWVRNDLTSYVDQHPYWFECDQFIHLWYKKHRYKNTSLITKYAISKLEEKFK